MSRLKLKVACISNVVGGLSDRPDWPFAAVPVGGSRSSAIRDLADGSVKTTYGYARVSTVGQTLEAQLEGLKAAGCQRIFREKVSGARADRRELNKMLRKIEAGDVVVVTRIDRLARSTFDLFAIVKSIVDRKAQFRSLAEPWADTTTSTGRLMIAILGGLADVERDLIRTRTAEGRERAKARGVKLGRKPKLTPQQKHEALARRNAGETLMEIARSYNVSFATISRLKP
jgi:DNA invertase Pin-like site-specific DNA recombinase